MVVLAVHGPLWDFIFVNHCRYDIILDIIIFYLDFIKKVRIKIKKK